jgi:hypothetical protein
MEAEAEILRRIGEHRASVEAASTRFYAVLNSPRQQDADKAQAIRDYKASVEAQKAEWANIQYDIDQRDWLEEGGGESETVTFDIVTSHKERILDEWEEPDDIWTMQAEL